MKTCSKCGKAKSLNEFNKHRCKKDGVQPYCKECAKEYRKQHYQKNKEEEKAYNQQYYQQNRERKLEHQKAYQQSFDGRFKSIKANAKYRGISFKLSKEQLRPFWKKPCHYCGEMIPTLNLDRKDSSGIYELSNVVPCCPECNKKKGIQDYASFIIQNL